MRIAGAAEPHVAVRIVLFGADAGIDLAGLFDDLQPLDPVIP